MKSADFLKQWILLAEMLAFAHWCKRKLILCHGMYLTVECCLWWCCRLLIFKASSPLEKTCFRVWRRRNCLTNIDLNPIFPRIDRPIYLQEPRVPLSKGQCSQNCIVYMRAQTIQRISSLCRGPKPFYRMAFGTFALTTLESGYVSTEKTLRQERRSNSWVLLWKWERLSSSSPWWTKLQQLARQRHTINHSKPKVDCRQKLLLQGRKQGNMQLLQGKLISWPNKLWVAHFHYIMSAVDCCWDAVEAASCPRESISYLSTETEPNSDKLSRPCNCKSCMHIFWFSITKQFWKVHALHRKLCFLHFIWHQKLAVHLCGCGGNHYH